MTRTIHPLVPEDLDDLGRFLSVGFHLPTDSDFVAQDVLRWKYLEPRSDDDQVPRSYLARDDAGHVIGHVGICRTFFDGDAILSGRVATLHMMDWLASAEHRSVGVSLMRKIHESVPTQFVVGGTEACRAVVKRSGYIPGNALPIYQRILRPVHWLRVPKLSIAERGAHLARDVVRMVALPQRVTSIGVKLRKVPAFGLEIEPIVQQARAKAILTGRNLARLNHLLRFPRQAMSGWHLVTSSDQLCGFAILNLVPQYGGRVLMGKIVDCLLAETDVRLWHGAVVALTGELKRQGADMAQTFVGTPWLVGALHQSGFTSRFALEFTLRDRQQLLPAGVPFHLMPIEADYAYS